MTDCTILLQGKINDDCLKLWIENHSDKKVILSVWQDEELWKYQFPEKWEIYINQYPIIRFWEHANLDYQLITTLTGLKAVTTKYVIKMRCDEYWSNVENIYNKILLNDAKIVAGSMFFRKWGMYKFHCSDKILAGKTDNVKRMFEQTIKNLTEKVWDIKIPECQLGLAWVMCNENDIDLKRLYPSLGTLVNFEVSSNNFFKGLDIVMRDINDIVNRQFNPDYTNQIKFQKISEVLIKDSFILKECANLIIPKPKIEPLDDKHLMRKWFDIINVNELKPYIATQNLGKKRRWFKSDFDHDDEISLTNINDD